MFFYRRLARTSFSNCQNTPANTKNKQIISTSLLYQRGVDDVSEAMSTRENSGT